MPSKWNSPMRLALAVMLALMAASPAWALKLTDDEAMAVSCRSYLGSVGSAVHGATVAAIFERLSGSPNAERFGSVCNMGDYIMAECRAHPADDVRGAVERLERAGAAGRLPHIPMCGA